ncbi:MAG: hypothetical protein QF790_04755 [Gammaproteobacteria bacterium]|jgi:hypothetical protein|nr:hypothetical protein [Gammaproteobacteria bacterium]MDP6616459.1 hypothetical protein [Gammaproteobacteria bacterium]MDP6695842.1 hypothetical protein [Gammaproteobacteria bacterium]
MLRWHNGSGTGHRCFANDPRAGLPGGLPKPMKNTNYAIERGPKE